MNGWDKLTSEFFKIIYQAVHDTAELKPKTIKERKWIAEDAADECTKIAKAWWRVKPRRERKDPTPPSDKDRQH